MAIEEIIDAHLGLSETLSVYSKTRTMGRPRTVSELLLDQCMVTAFHDALWDACGLELQCQKNTFPVLCNVLAKLNKQNMGFKSNILTASN